MTQRYPRVFRVRQKFDTPSIGDVQAAVRNQLIHMDLGREVRPGQSVAVTAGSRGIANMAAILRAIVEHLRGLGAEPFVVPAMGSHGGATGQGQQEVLHCYGITEASLGCPIRSSMETVVVCQTAEGFPVHFDRHAFEADHVVVCNRIKPHTRFVGDVESGLMKMLLIGLGKCAGATVYHRAIQDYSFAQIVRSVAGEVMRRCRILAGVAVVENARDETALIEAVAPEDFERREKELLVLAQQWMPKLPFQQRGCALDRPDRQGHQRHVPGHQRGRAQVRRPQGGRGGIPQSEGDRAPRADRSDARQRGGSGNRRVLQIAASAGDGFTRSRGSTPSPPATSPRRCFP